MTQRYMTTAQANAAMGWTPSKLRAYYNARAQACRQMADEGACLARVARHTAITIEPGFSGACFSGGEPRGIGSYYRSHLGDSGDGLGQTEGQVAGNVINALALVIRDPEGTMRVQGPAIVAAADRHIVGPLVGSAVRAAAPYIYRYAIPAFGLLYLLSGAAAYFSFQVLKRESRGLKPNRRRSRRRRKSR
jgi:hypothetical protein